MTDLGNGYSAKGDGDNPHAEVRSMPFFPGSAAAGSGGHPPSAPSAPSVASAAAAAVPRIPAQAGPRSAPVGAGAAGVAGRHSQRQSLEVAGDQAPPGSGAIQGRITIEDEVVEKIATLAALEVTGIATLGGHAARAPDGSVTPQPGVRIHVNDSEVSLNLSVVVEYGSVIMDVARVVKTNVARVVGLMLGMRVVVVDVTVDDVRMPAGDA